MDDPFRSSASVNEWSARRLSLADSFVDNALDADAAQDAAVDPTGFDLSAGSDPTAGIDPTAGFDLTAGFDPSAGFDLSGRAAAARRDRAVRAAVEQGLISPRQPVAGFYDLAALDDARRALQAAFAGLPVRHTFAVKAAPLVPVLRLFAAAGLGAEAAGPGELALARAAGFPADRIVLDSPAKTTDELRDALSAGVEVNADNFDELARIDALRRELGPASAGGARAADQPAGRFGHHRRDQHGLGAVQVRCPAARSGCPGPDRRRLRPVSVAQPAARARRLAGLPAGADRGRGARGLRTGRRAQRHGCGAR